MPHSRMTALASALSSSPLTMAPARPMVRPFGAVTPAMKPTTGLVPFSAIHRAALTSRSVISPIMMMPSVSSSAMSSCTASSVVVPMMVTTDDGRA